MTAFAEPARPSVRRTQWVLERDSVADRHRVRILAIPGSLRAGSYNRKVLRAAQGLVPPAAELELWDGLKAVPPFDEDDEHSPDPAVLALHDAIEQADAVLISTPQYNGSIPGQLKNALDWASRPYDSNRLRGKPVAVIGASPSPSGARRAQAEARTVLAVIGAEVVDSELSVARAHAQFTSDGRLGAREHRDSLTEILEQLIALAACSDALAAYTERSCGARHTTPKETNRCTQS